VRTLRWILVPALTLLVAGAAYACDKDHAATQKASANASVSSSSCSSTTAASAGAGCCAGKTAAVQASAGGCSAHSAAECQGHKMAMAANADCPWCNLVTQLRAQKGKVTFTTVEGKDGVTLVFAAVSKDNVTQAQEMANATYSMINAPAHCAYAASAMAEKECQDCKKSMEALSNATVSLENTTNGAQTLVKPANKEQIAKLQAFLQSLVAEVNTQS
jgi:hypothetical protein